MNNFEWNFSTRLVYGPGRLSELGDMVKPYGRKVMLQQVGIQDSKSRHSRS